MSQPSREQDLVERLAIITGGGDGIGRALAVKLTTIGCHVAICDVSESGMAETAELCDEAGGNGRLSTHTADVTSEVDLESFRDEALAAHQRDAVQLVFLNAGISAAGSLFTDSREAWERTFDVSWRGVYLGTRVFLPLLVASDFGRIVTTSSVNGFHASLGPSRPHTAYSAAKFAVKGFTEALITDLEVNAPHVEASVVMPGHVGTGIAENSFSAMTGGKPSAKMQDAARRFRHDAPVTASEAAQTILDAILAREWRILIGDAAKRLDQAVRTDPAGAYTPAFLKRLAKAEAEARA